MFKSFKNSLNIIKGFVVNSILALRDAGTKTKLASSLLIMTIVGGAVAPVIMGYIADFSKTYPSFLTLKEGVFSKITPSLFTLKEGSTSHPYPLSSGAREETALLGARNRYALRLADHQRSSPDYAGWDRLTIACFWSSPDCAGWNRWEKGSL